MRLIRCHIENFGKLQNFDFIFDEGLNTIKQPNGFGKTTFAHFIKAMLYGLPATTKRDVNQNIRKKYTPWQAGAYGGFLETEIGGKTYRIERFFGKKENEDTFKVVDLATGKVTNKFGSKLGEDVFGIDCEAYERSTYLPQQKLEQGINESIQNRLTSVLHGSDNSESLQLALDVLDKKRAELKNKQNKGLISSVNEKIEQTELEIESLKLKYQEVESLKNQIKGFDLKIEEIALKQEKVKEDIKVLNKIQQFKDNKKYVEENQEKLQKYNSIVQKSDEILNKNDKLAEKCDGFGLKSAEVETLKTKLKTIKETSLLNQEKEELTSYFKGEKVSRDKLNELIEKEKNIKTIEVQPENNIKPKKKNVAVYIGLIVGLIGLIVGGLLVKNYLTSGIVSFVLAIISLGFSGFSYFKNFIEIKTSVQTYQKQDLSDDSIIKNEIIEFINKTTEPIGDLKLNLFNIKTKLDQLESLQKKIDNENQLLENLQNQIETLDEEISKFISNFNAGKNHQLAIEVIKQALKDKGQAVREIDLINKNVEEFNLISDFNQDELDRFEGIDIEKLINNQKELQDAIDKEKEKKTKVETNIKRLNEDIAELDILENSLEQLKDEKLRLEDEFKLINLTKKFLNDAKDSLTSKYISPMFEGLTKYLKLIAKEDLKVNLDTNLKVSLESYSALRELEYMSEGYQTIINLSLRLALIEAIFNKEKPFIVLDDPFVNLDEIKTEKAIQLLKEISKNYQIIYLVCHNSRI